MRTRGCPVVIDVGGQRIDSGLRAPSTEQPVVVALRLRDRGWDPYKVSFDPAAGLWIGRVLETKTSLRRAGGSGGG